MILYLPQRIILTSGVGEGSTALNAFDNALLNAGVGDLNLIKVTSVVPIRARISKRHVLSHLDIKKGMLVPAVYTNITNNNPHERITAALVVGLPRDKQMNGLIFEASIVGTLASANSICERMIKEAFKDRGVTTWDLLFEGKETLVETKVKSVIALALMLP